MLQARQINPQTIITNNLYYTAYSDPKMKNIFPEGSVNITYKRGKSSEV